MNIILKSFDGEYCKDILESALQSFQLGTCISVADDQSQLPDVPTEKHIWLPAGDVRVGQYPDTDWNALRPIDEELIERMQPTEAVFLNMIGRYAVSLDMPYQDRMQQYFRHLRYWNHILEEEQIDLLLLNHQPHQGYDYVLYNLCKLKGIPTLYLERCYIMDAFFVPSDWEQSAQELEVELTKLRAEYGDDHVPLSAKYEHYFTSQTTTNETPWYMSQRNDHTKQKSFVSKWGGATLRGLLKKPKQVLTALLSPQIWAHKLQQHKISTLYDKYVEHQPDLDKPYIYLPLHYQPEATTCPMAGAYTHQLLIVQMLVHAVPEGMGIYVKEHPNQGDLCRTTEFYETLATIPNVTLVPKTLSTFALTENSVAVATATGTAAFEALFRSKPVLMFGHRFFQYAPSVYSVHSMADLQQALQSILENNQAPTVQDMRLFLKAVENCAGKTYVGPPDSAEEPYTKDEQAAYMGTVIAAKIQAALGLNTSA